MGVLALFLNILIGAVLAGAEPNSSGRPELVPGTRAAVLAALYDLSAPLALEASRALDALAAEGPAAGLAPWRRLQESACKGEVREPAEDKLALPYVMWPKLPALPQLAGPSADLALWPLLVLSSILCAVVCLGRCEALFRIEGELAIDKESVNMQERRQIFLLEPDVMGNYAARFSLIMNTTIQLSLLAMTLASFKSLTDAFPGGFEIFEWYLLVMFTGEWFANALTCPSLGAYFLRPATWIDVAAVFPSYMDVFMAEEKGNLQHLKLARLTRLFRMFRCCRLFRLVKLAGKSEQIEMILAGVQDCGPGFFIAIITITLAVYVPSVVIFYLEQGEWDAGMDCFRRVLMDGQIEDGCSPFQNILEAHYWGFTTVTTVGYGDVLPATDAGRVVTCCTMITGILALSLPIGMISNTFSDSMQRVHRERAEAKAEMHELQQSLGSGINGSEQAEQLQKLYAKSSTGSRSRLNMGDSQEKGKSNGSYRPLARISAGEGPGLL